MNPSLAPFLFWTGGAAITGGVVIGFVLASAVHAAGAKNPNDAWRVVAAKYKGLLLAYFAFLGFALVALIALSAMMK